MKEESFLQMLCEQPSGISSLGFKFWKPFEIADVAKTTVERFVNAHIPPAFELYPFDAHREPFVILEAKDNFGRLLGVAAVEAEAPNRDLKSHPYHIEINYIAVHPDFRRRNLARYLIGQAALFTILGLGRPPLFINGICKEEQRSFYERLGFQVTNPFEPLPKGLVPNGGLGISIDPNYPCSFWKEWDDMDDLWMSEIIREASKQ